MREKEDFFYKFSKNSKALTLVELLVATVLMGIVMTGVISAEYAARSAEQKNSRGSLVSMITSALLLDMNKNLSLATGNVGDRGISSNQEIDPNWTGPTDLCVRKEDPTNATPDPGDYSDDRWTCYTKIGFNLWTCDQLATPRACTGADRLLGQLNAFLVDVTADAVAHNFYVDLSIANRYDHAAAVSPSTNPQVTVTARVYPTQHSF